MAIAVKQEPLYPSITKPGVFYYDSENETLWEGYTGIDDSEINRFKFSIGSWTELKAQNRSIKLIPNEDMDYISSGLTSGTGGSAKPGDPPPGWLDNTEENVLAEGDVKPPRDSNDMSQRFEAMFKHPYFIAGPDGDDIYRSDRTKEGTFYVPIVAGVIDPYYMISDGDEGNRRGRVKERYNVSFFQQETLIGGNPNLEPKDIGFHENATSKSPELKLSIPGKGYWKADISDISVPVPEEETTVGAAFSFLRNVTFGAYTDLLDIGRGRDRIVRYKWKPNLHAFQKFNRVGSYSEDFEWIWARVGKGEGFNGSDFDWVKLPAILDTPEYQTPENIFVGVPIISNEVPEILNGLASGVLSENQLPVFHPPDTDNYTDTTAPLRLNFGLDLFQLDIRDQFAGNKFKFHVLEWGDEDVKLSNEEILNSEFFTLYNVDDDTFDKSQAKKLLQIISNAKRYKSYGSTQYPQNETLNFYQHTYTDSGVFSIKTVIFRMNSNHTVLLETILLNTNIVVNDAGESLQDFNIFGASDFNVLPLKTDINDKEIIIGGITERSKYVKSVRKIERDDVYGQQDYLEKTYNEKFLPLMEQSIYGDHLNKIDLSTTRVFTKPYDLSYFTDRIPMTEQRSRATDILIDNNECVFEINPSEIDGGVLENTGKSNERAIIIGDYKLIKEQNREMRKEDSMDIPKIETRRNNQAF